MNRSNLNLPSRGRGRRIPTPSQRTNQNYASSNGKENSHSSVIERFQAASQKHKESNQQILKEAASNSHHALYYESSSEEEELEEDAIVDNLTKNYQGFGDNEKDGLKTTAQYLTEACQSGALTCLVCISSIKRTQKVWNCSKCYACFHLECIRNWILQGIAKKTMLSDEHFPNKELPWNCPKCRHEYQRSEMPTEYLCFCGKMSDPVNDSWTLPHSCGEICGKKLQKNPGCQHTCLLLCHPGPCPPCPQTIKLSCHCGSSRPISKRCGQGKWSCGGICDKLLECKLHRCKEVCHKGECPPCKHTSIKYCQCGSSKKLLPCVQSSWQCDKVCGKILSCGFHYCEKKCHPPGECSKCPHENQVRTCPCGKTQYDDLTCKDTPPLCRDTCGKLLGCHGDHRCTRRCHYGECGQCPAVAVKKCRCGRREKTMPCHKTYTCDYKCQKTKLCGKHPCKRKCCDGNCAECEQICNKLLQCKKHRCKMVCHNGSCYPCIMTSQLSCPCGETKLTVVCGKEKTTKPPKCKKLCLAPPDCHHAERIKHKCHVGECPPCKQVCDIKLSCGHFCPELCHDRVKNKKVLRPWEKQESKYLKLDCPPCMVPVGVECAGKHEIVTFPCHLAKENYSCGRLCGRTLKCTNHKCELKCHVVENAVDEIKSGSNCMECESHCLKKRPPGCAHECMLPCHPGPCPPCKKKLRKRCHCDKQQLKFICHDWTSASDDVKRQMLSCQQPCNVIMEKCGHKCPLLCHNGPCLTSEKCEKKVWLKCKCKRIKKEIKCQQLYTDEKVDQNIKCDEICKQLKKSRAKELQEAAENKRKVEIPEAETVEEKKHKKNKHFNQGTKRKHVNKFQPSEGDVERNNVYLFVFAGIFFALVASGVAFYMEII